MTSACSGCLKPIIWATTERGRLIPLDEQPVAGGTIALEERDSRHQPVARFLGVTESKSFGVAYVSHFATCVDAHKFRKGR